MEDKRFIEKRVSLKAWLLKRMISEIRDYNHFTWKDLSKVLGLSEHSIRNDWLNKGNTIPLSIFKKLIKLHPNLTYNDLKNKLVIRSPYWGQRVGKKSPKHGKITLPKANSKNFAEFYGILLGDGCIYSNLNGFCISSNSVVDKNYIEKYVYNLVRSLFNVAPKLYYSKKEKAIRCVLYSRKIARFLVSLGFPKGKKKNSNLCIPKIFFKESSLLKSCLRGLIDTDGSVCPHPNSKIMVSVSITSTTLLESTLLGFEKLGLDVGSYNKGINIYGKKKVKNIFSSIGSSNWKNIHKYNTFVTTGRMPYTKEIESLLISSS